MPPPALSLAAIRQPAFLYGPDGRVAEANDLAVALAGGRLDGASGAEIIRIFGHRSPDGSFLSPPELPSARALAGDEVIDLPLAITAADGRTVHVLASASPIREGDTIAGALVILQEITGRVMAEEALRRSEERFRDVLDVSLDAMYRCDLVADRIDYVSPVNETLTGFAAEEFGALTFEAFSDRVHPADRDRVIGLAAAIEGGCTGRGGTIEYRFRHRDGTWRWLSDHFTIQADTDGRPRYRVGVVRDVTRRHEIEAALCESEERLRLARESAGIGIWDRNTATDRVTVTPEFLERYGLRAEAITTFSDWLRFVHPDDRERLEVGRRTIVADGESVDLQYRVVTPSGEVRWLEFKGRAVAGDGCAPVRVVGVLIDVTDRRRIEEALRESEARFRLALSNAPTALFHQDRDLRYTWVSNPHAAFAGAGLVGKTDADVMSPGEAAPIVALKQRVLETGESLRGEVRIAHEGETRYYDLAVEPLEDVAGETVGIKGVSNDITERVRAEEALHRSQQYLADVIEASGAAFFHVAADRSHGTVSRRFAEFLGFHPGDLPPFPAFIRWVLPRVHPDDETSLVATFAAITAGETPRIDLEFRIMARDGTYRWLRAVSASIERDPSGRPRSVAGLLFDTTDRKLAEGALRENEERLRLAQAGAGIGIWEGVMAPGQGGLPESIHIHDENFPALTELGDWRGAIHPDDRERVEMGMEAGIALGEPIEEEFRYEFPDGRSGWLRILGGGIYEEAGALSRVLGVYVDITDQKEAEATLRESEQRHAFLVTLGDRLRELSDAGEIAAAATEMLGRHLGINNVVYLETDAEGDRATVRASWTDGTVPSVTGSFSLNDLGVGDLFRHRGVVRDSEVPVPRNRRVAVLYRDFGIRGLMAVPVCRGGRFAAVLAGYTTAPRAWTDAEIELVNETADRLWSAVAQARAEEALWKRERTLQGIFRAAPVGIGMVTDRTITMINDQLGRMTGYTREELVGQDARLLYPDDEAYESVGVEKYDQIAASGIGVLETRWRRKDGTALDILLSVSPIDLSRPDEDVVFTVLDITRLRESERALASYTDDLQRSNEELRQFAYMANHDL